MSNNYLVIIGKPVKGLIFGDGGSNSVILWSAPTATAGSAPTGIVPG